MAVDYGDIAMIKRMLASTGTTYDANTDARLIALNTSISRVLEHVLGRSFGTAPPPEGTTRLVYGRGSDMLFLPTPGWLISSVGVGGAGAGGPARRRRQRHALPADAGLADCQCRRRRRGRRRPDERRQPA